MILLKFFGWEKLIFFHIILKMSLHQSVGKGNLLKCKELVSQGVEVNQFNKKMFTPLLIATINRNLGIVQFLVANGADVNLFHYQPVIAIAAEYGDLEIVKFLHQNGAKINLGPYTPLWISSQYGHSQVVEFLLQIGDNPNIIYKTVSPLYSAIYNGHLDTVKILLQYGADINFQRDNGCSLYELVIVKKQYEIMKYFLDTDLINVNLTFSTNIQRRTLLVAAIKINDLQMVELLLQYGAHVNFTMGEYGKPDSISPPLYHACHHGRLDIIKLLIENGADVNQKVGNHNPLSHCINDNVRKLLLSKILHTT